jgi:hypothetical protein
MGNLAFQITWDPGIRGVLVVVVGITVLMGSVYAILATNLGARLGFLVAVGALSGWMAMMGIVWATYGIGYKGSQGSWKVEEVVTSSSADDLSASRLEKARDLSKWREMAADNPSRGEAQAAATAAIIKPAAGAEASANSVVLYDADTDFVVIDAFDTGGKTKNFYNKNFPGPHPAHYAIIQVQGVVEQKVPFGETPPTPKADPSKPVRSVVLIRDLGKRRLPPVLIAIASGIVFAITCSALHRRDRAVAAARAAALT